MCATGEQYNSMKLLHNKLKRACMWHTSNYCW